MKPPIRLHLGSHINYLGGWVNIDLAGIPIDLPLDVTRRLPFFDSTVEAIFHEHLLEHLSLREGMALTRECWRVLEPGGVLRVGVPDCGEAINRYTRREGKPTPMLRMQEMFYEHGHLTMYDAPTLFALFEECGFRGVAERDRGDSRLSPCPDGERDPSVFVEGVKEPETRGPGPL
jgi:predicted SAM-dependent methyltransferase